MTRYNNPLPLNQVPNSQGRPAGSGAGQQPQQTYQQPGWPQQGAGSSRSAGQGYGDAGGYGADQLSGAGRQPDPYAALRPDGYAYGQPQQPATSDPYGLAGYTAPQSQASFGSASRTQQSAPPAPSYATQASPSPYGGQQASSYGGQQADPYGSSRAPASSFGNSQAGYGSSSAGYGSLTAAPPQPSYGSSANSSAPPPAAYGASSSMPPQPSYGSHASTGGGDQWSNSLSMDARDYGHDYQHSGQGHSAGHATGQSGHWGDDHYGEPALDANGAYAAAPHAQHASFDQSYAEDDAQYEEAPRRGGWKKIIGLAACTVLLGGGLVLAYGSIMGGGETGDTPVIKSASGPSKVKPSDPGGRQFAHAESKLMGRLGEGGMEATPDPAGVRKVPVVTVGRDGSIQPPAAEPEETRAVVAVPGLTVIDGLGGGSSESMPSPARSTSPAPTKPSQGSGSAPLPVKMVSSSEETKPVVVAPPKKTAAEAPPAAPAPKKEKVAALTPPPAASSSGPKPTGAGYVAVLASVPASGSSRIEALKQFADMQQQYTSILSNKTPDVQEADLGEKGTYHRLLVGPPGSRESASSVCTQLKAQGYSGCWVTAY